MVVKTKNLYQNSLIKKQMKVLLKNRCIPNEARLRNLSYSCNIFCDILVVYKIFNDNEKKIDVIEKSFKHINLGKIPTMLSQICVLNNATTELKKQMGECPMTERIFYN